MAWFDPPTPEPFQLGAMPCYAIQTADLPGLHYGMPVIPGAAPYAGLKIAHHAPGPTADPDTLDRQPTDRDTDLLHSFVQRCMPQAAGPPVAAHICMYTNTPDGHFIIDRHPNHPNVTLACGFSGHGFKFTPVIGQGLADLATERRTDLPIDFLSLQRFA
jgi:sarcosine oxidase